MRKNLGVKTFIYPQPVLIVGTYDKDGNPNIMNAAWGMVADYDKIMICLANHKTTENIKINNEFSISIGEAGYVAECDYVGIVSQNDEPDKVKKSGFTTKKSEFVNAPIINELSLCIECRLIKILEEDLYLAEIVNVNADEKILVDGKISLEKFIPISYDPSTHGYYKVSSRVGNAFKDGKKLM